MGYTIHIDSSELNDVLTIMKDALSEEGFVRLMTRTFNEVGKRSKKIIYQATKADYVVKQKFAYAAIKNARISVGDGVNCVIPLAGPKGTVGSDFAAAGGARGWKVRKYRVKAKIVTAGQSTLPKNMPNQGGQPPFRNLAYSKIAFTRKGKSRLPIARVSALAFPQMPLNRSESEVADQILELTMKRLIHNFGYMFKG